jgi:hypothetical protein
MVIDEISISKIIGSWWVAKNKGIAENRFIYYCGTACPWLHLRRRLKAGCWLC